jgi:hypothetical protein
VFSVQDQLIGPNWNGAIVVEIEAAAPASEPDPKVALEKLIATLTTRIEIGAASLKMLPDSWSNTWPTASWKLILDRTKNPKVLAEVRDGLLGATADTPIRLVITRGEEAPLALAPRSKAIVPLALDPGSRRVLMTRMQTIAFGDPSYDRQLGSTTESAIGDIAAGRFMLAVDRQSYDTGSTLYFACGRMDPETGAFASGTGTFDLKFQRFGPLNPDGTPRDPDDLLIADMSPVDSQNHYYQCNFDEPLEITLQQLRYASGKPGDVCPLVAGDRLGVTAVIKDTTTTPPKSKELTVFVNIVATPVIAPPPCVYSVIEVIDGTLSSRVVLHAAAPLPQHIELPSLKQDLAKGYVRRRALFVWRFASIGDAKTSIELVKFDRSGGAQLPTQ